MTHSETVALIASIINRVLADKGEQPQSIGPDTIMLGGDLPIDSLDLAGIVVEIEAATGFDPFADGFIEFRTVSELAKLYHATAM